MKINLTEDVLSSENTSMQTFVEFVPTPIAIKGFDGKYKLCNQMFADIVGLSREEVVDKTAFELFPQDIARRSEIQDQKLLCSEDASFSEPSILPGEEGHSRHFIMQKAVLKDAAGKGLGIIGTGIEVPAARQMEKMVNSLAQCVSEHTGKEFFQQLAKLLAETLGAEHVVISRHSLEHDSVGQELAIYSQGAQQGRFACDLKDPSCWRVVSNGNHCTLPGEEKLFCRDCMLYGVTDAGFIGTTLYGQNGDIVGAISVVNKNKIIRNGFARDVLNSFAARASGEIQRLEAEEEMAKTRDFYMNMLNSIPAMTWRTDADGEYDYFNESLLVFTGLGLDEALQGACNKLVHPDDAGQFFESFRSAFSLQTNFQLEYRFRRHDGVYRWVLTAGRPFYTSAGGFAGYVGSCIDITDRKINEEHLRQVQRMEALGKLSGGIAHEFNNILAVIEGHAELLKMKNENDASLTKALNAIIQASGRASHLTASMMAYTQKQLCKPEVVDLNQIVCGMERLLNNVIHKELNLKIELGQNPLPVCVDAGQIEQVLMNLATNARDALSSGGTLIVRTEEADQVAVCNDVAWESSSGRYAVLSVIDNGCGMSPETLNKMYEPYFTTKEVGKGTGLGLSAAYGVVKQHKGDIFCCSDEGRGTTFTIYLPLNERVEKFEPEEPMLKEIVARNLPQLSAKGTVLLVDDDEMVRAVVEELLNSQGYMVLSAACGDEALQLYQQHASRISLVIVDFNMPQKNGGEVLKELRRKKCALPVVIMSGDLNVPVDADFDKGLIVEKLSKPFQPETLLAKVKELIQQNLNN